MPKCLANFIDLLYLFYLFICIAGGESDFKRLKLSRCFFILNFSIILAKGEWQENELNYPLYVHYSEKGEANLFLSHHSVFLRQEWACWPPKKKGLPPTYSTSQLYCVGEAGTSYFPNPNYFRELGTSYWSTIPKKQRLPTSQLSQRTRDFLLPNYPRQQLSTNPREAFL